MISFSLHYATFYRLVISLERGDFVATAVVLAFLMGEGGDLDPPAGRSGAPRNAVKGGSVGSDGVCSSLGVLNPGIDVQVVDTIAGFVVADVVVDASFPAPPDLNEKIEIKFKEETGN